MNESNLLKEKALNFVLTINEINSSLSKFDKTKLKPLKILLESLTEVSTFKISLPDKLIDTLLTILIKSLETLLKNKSIDSEVLIIVNQLIFLDSIIIAYSTEKDYLKKKWNFVSQILMINLNLLYTKDDKNGIIINLEFEKEILLFLEKIFLNIGQSLKFEILPSLISRLVNYFSRFETLHLSNTKLALKILQCCFSLVCLVLNNLIIKENKISIQLNPDIALETELRLCLNKMSSQQIARNIINTIEYIANAIFILLDFVLHNENSKLKRIVLPTSPEISQLLNSVFRLDVNKLILLNNFDGTSSKLNINDNLLNLAFISVRLASQILFRENYNLNFFCFSNEINKNCDYLVCLLSNEQIKVR
jgi:hypothetical protein